MSIRNIYKEFSFSNIQLFSFSYHRLQYHESPDVVSDQDLLPTQSRESFLVPQWAQIRVLLHWRQEDKVS